MRQTGRDRNISDSQRKEFSCPMGKKRGDKKRDISTVFIKEGICKTGSVTANQLQC